MKIIPILFFIAVVYFSMPGQDYHFVGIYRKKEAGKSYWCQDRGLEQQALTSSGSYDTVKKAFYTAHPKDVIGTYLLSPKSAALVYEFETPMPGFNCSYKAIAVTYAPDLDSAYLFIKKNVAQYPKHYLSKPVILFSWKGNGAFRHFKEVDYAGVVVKYTSIKTEAGKAYFFAQGKNTYTDQDASLLITSGQKVVAKLKVAPGGSFNHRIDCSEFDIEIELAPSKPAEVGIIDRIKKLIKDHITDKEGKIQSRPGGIGVRG